MAVDIVDGGSSFVVAPEPERWGVWCENVSGLTQHASGWTKDHASGWTKDSDGDPVQHDKANALRVAAAKVYTGWTFEARPLPAEGKAPAVVEALIAADALARALFATDERVIAFALERSEFRYETGSADPPAQCDAVIAKAWERGASHEPERTWRRESEARGAAVAAHGVSALSARASIPRMRNSAAYSSASSAARAGEGRR